MGSPDATSKGITFDKRIVSLVELLRSCRSALGKSDAGSLAQHHQCGKMRPAVGKGIAGKAFVF